jgi:exopolysaccharide biosynthesis polyprenyl glycosylphosphotransferase
MLRAHAAQLYRASIFVDVVAGACLFLGWYGLQLDSPLSGALLDWRVLALLGVASLSWPIAAYHLGLYGSQRRRNIYQLTGRLLVLAIVSGLSLASADLLLGRLLPRRTVLLFIGSQFAFITLIRLIAFASLQKIRRSGRNYRNLLVIGSGPRARRVQEIVSARPEWGLHIVGFVDPEAIRVDCGLPPDAIHKPMEVLDLLREEAVDEVIVACPRSMLDRIGPIVETCATAGVPLTLMADLFGDSLPPPRVTYLGSLVALSFAPVHHSPIKLRIKRAIDVVGASAGLIVVAPILAAAAVAIRSTSPGPVFFRQERCGLYGRRFTMWKLRTMRVDAELELEDLRDANEMDGPVFKIRGDPRVTPVGRVLRRFSLDEVPQLWNVLRGDMSFVGPRPPVFPEVRKYATFDMRRLSMRPGITCLWQVSGRNLIGFSDWVKLDLQYIDNWSLTLDFVILLRTVPAVLSARGAS